MASVTIENLMKTFDDGEIIAVDDLSLELEDGEFVVIVGPSGCGKTTTLNCIAGLETPTSGRIYLDDEDVTDKRSQQRDIAMVFQNYALYPHKNARQNIAFGLQMRSELNDDAIRERVDEVAELLEISDLLHQRPGSLSGGQQQRVALGRAIARDPEVFLMDEPLSNLDAKLRTQMRAELQSLQEELGVTSIYVTHDQEEAMTMGDRIVILYDGQLQQVATPLECYHEPKNEFVAGFIGSPSMNFFNGTRTDGELKHDAFTYSLSEEFQDRLGDTPDDLRLGIRPENIRITEEREENSIAAEVDVVEPMGNVSHLFVNIEDEQCILSVDGSLLLNSGERIYLDFPEEMIHVFDAETGEALLNRSAPYEEREPMLSTS